MTIDLGAPPSAQAGSLGPDSGPHGPDSPIRRTRFTPSQLTELLGSLAAAAALIWVIFSLEDLKAPFGMVVSTFLLFLLIYGVLTRHLHGILYMKDRLATVTIWSVSIAALIPLGTGDPLRDHQGCPGGACRLPPLLLRRHVTAGPYGQCDRGRCGGSHRRNRGAGGDRHHPHRAAGNLCATYLVESSSVYSRIVGNVVDAMTGAPAIILGLFVYLLWVVPHKTEGKSGLAAALALAVMMLPIVTRTSEEVIVIVPGSLREAAAALGAPRWRILMRVVLPTARIGLATAVILGVARIAGETAPILFNAGGNNKYNWNPFHGQQDNLPLRIYELIFQPSANATRIAWGSPSCSCLWLWSSSSSDVSSGRRARADVGFPSRSFDDQRGKLMSASSQPRRAMTAEPATNCIDRTRSNLMNRLGHSFRGEGPPRRFGRGVRAIGLVSLASVAGLAMVLGPVAAGASTVPSTGGSTNTSQPATAGVASTTTTMASNNSTGPSTTTTTPTASGGSTVAPKPGVLFAPQPHGAVTLNGVGSSFAAPAISQWTKDVQNSPYNLNLNYSSTYSGDGRYEFTNQTTDFAVSDIAYAGLREHRPSRRASRSSSSRHGRRDRLHVQHPWTAKNLQLTSYTACAILTGGITNWNDSQDRRRQRRGGAAEPAHRPGHGERLRRYELRARGVVYRRTARRSGRPSPTQLHQNGGPTDGVAISPTAPNSNWPGVSNGLDTTTTTAVAGRHRHPARSHRCGPGAVRQRPQLRQGRPDQGRGLGQEQQWAVHAAHRRRCVLGAGLRHPAGQRDPPAELQWRRPPRLQPVDLQLPADADRRLVAEQGCGAERVRQLRADAGPAAGAFSSVTPDWVSRLNSTGSRQSPPTFPVRCLRPRRRPRPTPAET